MWSTKKSGRGGQEELGKSRPYQRYDVIKGKGECSTETKARRAGVASSEHAYCKRQAVCVSCSSHLDMDTRLALYSLHFAREACSQEEGALGPPAAEGAACTRISPFPGKTVNTRRGPQWDVRG